MKQQEIRYPLPDFPDQETAKPLDLQPILKMAPPLIQWFVQYHRKLPWRMVDREKRSHPYQVWVSEIMLQQTRVEAVKEYYTRFMREFPTVQALAQAPQQQLLKLWEGLGYYSRARNLQKAAQQVVEQWGGELAPHREMLRKLPGVGSYTSGAIASIAFGEPVPAVDGNVLRVIARVLDCHRDITRPDTKAAVERCLEQVLLCEGPARQRPDLFNQALMELGATVCIPNGAPACERCPVNRFCIGFSRSTASSLPVKGVKKPRRVEYRTVALLRWNGKVALCQRPSKGLLAGLWELPNLEGKLSCEQLAQQLEISPSQVEIAHPPRGARHLFTHIQWEMTGWELILADGSVPPGPENWVWLTPEQQKAYSVPSALRVYREMI